MDTLFHALVENSSQAIAMIDASGHILFASESATRIVYGIAKEAGGTISFSAADRQGSTFEVLLPLTAAI